MCGPRPVGRQGAHETRLAQGKTRELRRVWEEEGGDCAEVSVEDDGTVHLPSISSVFPGTTGLKYWNPDTQAGRMRSPREVWSPNKEGLAKELVETKLKNQGPEEGTYTSSWTSTQSIWEPMLSKQHGG